jgi:hypothetical protein
MKIISITNKCKACQFCPITTRNAIDFSEVDNLELLEASFLAENSHPEEEFRDYRQVNEILSKVKIDTSRLTPNMVSTLQELCPYDAFIIKEIEG